MEFARKGETELISIDDSHGRFLAEDIKATHDVPHFDRSPYDGFAIRANDTKEASPTNPVELEVIDHIGAGMVSSKTVGPFQAVRIMTGAQMPNGSDAVVMLELAKEANKDGKNSYQLSGLLRKGIMFRFEERTQ